MLVPGSVLERRVGRRIGQLRRDRGWSLAELARRSGVSSTTVANLESGKSRWPAPLILGGLSQALGVSRAEILGLSEIPHYDTVGQATAAMVADVAGLICWREQLGLRIDLPQSDPVRNRSDADVDLTPEDWH